MAYKNADTTSSIANEFGQWRYFNSSLEKLGAFKAPTMHVDASAVPVEKEVNWISALGSAFSSGLKGYEAYQNHAYSKADEYVKTHSMEEYIKEIKSKGIPFQDDPIAMQKLKQNYGDVARNLAKRDFLDRVARNEFEGKSPSEIDAIYYAQMKASQKDLSDVLPFNTSDDYFFNKGFWENADKDRAEVLAQNSAVSNDWNKKEQFQMLNAKLRVLLTKPNLTSDEFVESINEGFKSGLYHLDPIEQSTALGNYLKTLSESANGQRLLLELEGKKVPNTELSFPEYFGDKVWASFKTDADNVAFTTKAKERDSWEAGVTSLKNEGNRNALFGLLDAEYKSNGNVETLQSKFIKESIADLDKEYEKVAKDNVNLNTGLQYLEEARKGKGLPDYKALGLTTDTLKKALQYGMDNGLYSFEDLISIASNPTLPDDANIPKKRFTQVANKAISVVEGVAEALSENREVTLTEGDKAAITAFRDLYRANPTKFFDVIGKRSSRPEEQESIRFTARALVAGLESGKSVSEIAKSVSWFNNLDKTKEGRELKRNLQDKVLDSILPDPGKSSNDTLDAYGKNVVYSLAGTYIKNGESLDDALDKAQEDMSMYYTNIMGSTIPNTILGGDKAGAEAVNAELEFILKEHNLKESDIIVSYNPYQYSINVSHKNGTLIERFSQSDVYAMTQEFKTLKAEAEQRKIDSNPSLMVRLYGKNRNPNEGREKARNRRDAYYTRDIPDLNTRLYDPNYSSEQYMEEQDKQFNIYR